jgi:hypothetical protein
VVPSSDRLTAWSSTLGPKPNSINTDGHDVLGLQFMNGLEGTQEEAIRNKCGRRLEVCCTILAYERPTNKNCSYFQLECIKHTFSNIVSTMTPVSCEPKFNWTSQASAFLDAQWLTLLRVVMTIIWLYQVWGKHKLLTFSHQ